MLEFFLSSFTKRWIKKNTYSELRDKSWWTDRWLFDLQAGWVTLGFQFADLFKPVRMLTVEQDAAAGWKLDFRYCFFFK